MNQKLKPLWVLGTIAYSLLIAYLCFRPQANIIPLGFETPGIYYVGRLVFLLTPLNSLWKVGEVTNPFQLYWIFMQNALNVLLLFPLIFQLLLLFPKLRQRRKVILLSFLISLGIECSQLLLDYFWDFNRVFEIDDLWTNTLGGYLAWLLYQAITRKQKKESK